MPEFAMPEMESAFVRFAVLLIAIRLAWLPSSALADAPTTDPARRRPLRKRHMDPRPANERRRGTHQADGRAVDPEGEAVRLPLICRTYTADPISPSPIEYKNMKKTHRMNADDIADSRQLIWKLGNMLLANAILWALLVCVPSSRAGDDLYPEAHPAAGIQPRRPSNYVPYKYPQSPQDLLKTDGPKMRKLAGQAWADIEEVNAAGPFKNTYESLATHQCPEWFKDAKIGMFIDWGPWSVGGYAPPSSGAAYPDWYEMNLHVEWRDYHTKTWGADIGGDDLINLLSDRDFEPSRFAKLARECGFRYVVPFLKHHGGFCLWDSSFTHRDSMDWAFHRDFATELSKACKREGLKFGAYVSVGEWDYPAIRPDGHIGTFGFNGRLRVDTNIDHYAFLSGKVPVRDYVKDYLVPSIKELMDKTKPDLVWYDGEWENVSSFWHTGDLDAYYYNMALRDKQEVCINDRWGDDARKKKSPNIKVDFATSEFGGGTITQSDAWEECRSFSHNFGYNWTEESDANAVLDDKACIDLVVDIIGRGGNLLLIVSPTGSGEIPPRQLHAIRNMGDWLNRYGHAIYGTRAYTLAKQPQWGRITHSKDGDFVYLLITHWPADGRIEVPAIPVPAIESVRVMHGEGNPRFTQPEKDGGFTVDLSACKPGDPRVSVVEIKTK
jgi:alpha-L-fucosidase